MYAERKIRKLRRALAMQLGAAVQIAGCERDIRESSNRAKINFWSVKPAALLTVAQLLQVINPCEPISGARATLNTIRLVPHEIVQKTN